MFLSIRLGEMKGSSPIKESQLSLLEKQTKHFSRRTAY